MSKVMLPITFQLNTYDITRSIALFSSENASAVFSCPKGIAMGRRLLCPFAKRNISIMLHCRRLDATSRPSCTFLRNDLCLRCSCPSSLPTTDHGSKFTTIFGMVSGHVSDVYLRLLLRISNDQLNKMFLVFSVNASYFGISMEQKPFLVVENHE